MSHLPAVYGGAGAPPLPPGPGVVPPFPKPPEERRLATLLIALGVGAVSVLVCGGLAVAGVIGVLAWAQADTAKKTREVATAFMDAIVAEDFRGAYEQQCEELRENQTLAEFTDQWQDSEGEAVVAGYELGDLVAVSGHPFVQEVELTTRSGGTQLIGLAMEAKPAEEKGESAVFQVCDVGTFEQSPSPGG